MKHENEIVVVLERLNLHARHGLHIVLRLLVVESRDLVFHEAGQLDVKVRVALADAFEQSFQLVLIQLGQLCETVVGQEIGEFLGFAAIVLEVHGHLHCAHEQRGFEPSVAAHDQPTAFAHGDRAAPALFLNDGREELDLMRAMPIRVLGIRLQCRRIDEGVVRAVDLHAQLGLSKARTLTVLRNLRTFRAVTHKQFAKLLTDWRDQNELTQQTAADKLGVSRRSLENWEQERAMPQGFGLNAMLAIIQGAKTRPGVKPQRRRT